MGKMMLSKSAFWCAFRGKNNPKKTKNFLKIIQMGPGQHGRKWGQKTGGGGASS